MMKLHICQLCQVLWEDDGEEIVFCHKCARELE